MSILEFEAVLEAISLMPAGFIIVERTCLPMMASNTTMPAKNMIRFVDFETLLLLTDFLILGIIFFIA